MIDSSSMGIRVIDVLSLGFTNSASFTLLKSNPNIGNEYVLGDDEVWIKRIDLQPLSILNFENVGGLHVPDSGLRVKLKPGLFKATLLVSVQARSVQFRLCLSEDVDDLADTPHAKVEYSEQVRLLELNLRPGNAAYLHILGGYNEVSLHSINLAD